MKSPIKNHSSTLLAALAAYVVVAVGTASDARAVLLNYEFNMTAASGSWMNLGSGSINLSGVAFTITGMTTSDTDLYNGGAVGDGIGEFAATSIFNFGALGSFTTDTSSDHYYFQNYSGPSSVSGAGLANLPIAVGFAGIFSPAVPGNPDFGVALGSPTVDSTATGNPWVIGNLSGQTLSLNFNSSSVTSMTVTEQGAAVPDGASTLGLLFISLLGLVAKQSRILGTRLLC